MGFFFKEYSEERYLISGISKLTSNIGSSKLWVDLGVYSQFSLSSFNFSSVALESPITRNYFTLGAKVGFGGFQIRGFISGGFSRNGFITVDTIPGKLPSLLRVNKNGEKTKITSWTMWEAQIGGEFHALRRPGKYNDFYLLASIGSSRYKFNLQNPNALLEIQTINYSTGAGYRMTPFSGRIAFNIELWYSYPREINETLYIKQDHRLSILAGISFYIGK